MEIFATQQCQEPRIRSELTLAIYRDFRTMALLCNQTAFHPEFTRYVRGLDHRTRHCHSLTLSDSTLLSRTDCPEASKPLFHGRRRVGNTLARDLIEAAKYSVEHQAKPLIEQNLRLGPWMISRT